MGVLLLSLIALIPGQGHAALGTEFTLAGSLGMATTLAGIGVLADFSFGLYLYGVAAAMILLLAFVSTWQLVS